MNNFIDSNKFMKLRIEVKKKTQMIIERIESEKEENDVY